MTSVQVRFVEHRTRRFVPGILGEHGWARTLDCDGTPGGEDDRRTGRGRYIRCVRYILSIRYIRSGRSNGCVRHIDAGHNRSCTHHARCRQCNWIGWFGARLGPGRDDRHDPRDRVVDEVFRRRTAFGLRIFVARAGFRTVVGLRLLAAVHAARTYRPFGTERDTSACPRPCVISSTSVNDPHAWEMTTLSIHATRPVEFVNVIDRVPAGILIVAVTVRQQLQFQAKSTTGMIIVTELSGGSPGFERGPGTDNSSAGPASAPPTSSDPDCDGPPTL